MVRFLCIDPMVSRSSPTTIELSPDAMKNANLTAKTYENDYSSSLSLKRALRESGCRIGYERTKMSRNHFFGGRYPGTPTWRFLPCPQKNDQRFEWTKLYM